MYPVSQRFLAECQKSHNRVTSVVVENAGGQTLDVSKYVTTGQVQLTADSMTRGTCQFTLGDATGQFVPHFANDFLTPFGNTVSIKTGVRYQDNTTELVPLGIFRLSDVEIDDDGTLTEPIKGSDFSRNVGRNLYDDDIHFTVYNTNIAQAIYDITMDRYPTAVWNDIPISPTGNIRTDLATLTTLTSGPQTVYSCGDSPLSKIQNWCGAAFLSYYVDRLGKFTLIVDPNFAFQQGNTPYPVASFTEGIGCSFSKLQRPISDSGAANEVVITGTGANVFGVPPRSYAYDNDITSPTYIGSPIGTSPYGRVVYSETNELLYNTVLTQTYANWTLATTIGAQERVQFQSTVLACLDPNDPIAITRVRAGLASVTYLLDTITIPLLPSQWMAATCRQRRSLLLPTPH